MSYLVDVYGNLRDFSAQRLEDMQSSVTACKERVTELSEAIIRDVVTYLSYAAAELPKAIKLLKAGLSIESVKKATALTIKQVEDCLAFYSKYKGLVFTLDDLIKGEVPLTLRGERLSDEVIDSMSKQAHLVNVLSERVKEQTRELSQEFVTTDSSFEPMAFSRYNETTCYQNAKGEAIFAEAQIPEELQNTQVKVAGKWESVFFATQCDSIKSFLNPLAHLELSGLEKLFVYLMVLVRIFTYAIAYAKGDFDKESNPIYKHLLDSGVYKNDISNFLQIRMEKRRAGEQGTYRRQVGAIIALSKAPLAYGTLSMYERNQGVGVELTPMAIATHEPSYIPMGPEEVDDFLQDLYERTKVSLARPVSPASTTSEELDSSLASEDSDSDVDAFPMNYPAAAAPLGYVHAVREEPISTEARRRSLVETFEEELFAEAPAVAAERVQREEEERAAYQRHSEELLRRKVIARGELPSGAQKIARHLFREDPEYLKSLVAFYNLHVLEGNYKEQARRIYNGYLTMYNSKVNAQVLNKINPFEVYAAFIKKHEQANPLEHRARQVADRASRAVRKRVNRFANKAKGVVSRFANQVENLRRNKPLLRDIE